MDRRQQKTKKAIFDALNTLLRKKNFESITVQEIIDEANIGRSTFYAHFETKDELLRTMCADIFHHIIANELPQESNHEYLDESQHLELKLGHLLYHLKEMEINLKGILKSESEGIFIQFLKEYLQDLFREYLEEFSTEIPRNFLLHYLTGSFVETVKWWFAEEAKYTPEEVAFFYMKAIGKDTMDQ